MDAWWHGPCTRGFSEELSRHARQGSFAHPDEPPNTKSGESSFVSESAHAAGADRKWFALSVTSRHEKIVSQLLCNQGFRNLPAALHPAAINMPAASERSASSVSRLSVLPLGFLQRVADPDHSRRPSNAGNRPDPIPVEDGEIRIASEAAQAGRQ